MHILVVTNMFPTSDEPSFGCFVKSQVESIEKRGIAIDIIFANGRRSKLNYIRGAWQVLWKSLLHRYDLIHAHYGISGLLARCQIRAPIVVSFCGSDVMDPMQNKISRLVSRWADLCIVKSKRLEIALGKRGARVIPSGVDLSMFRPIDTFQARKLLGLSDNTRYILFVGNPTNKPKRYDVALKTLHIAERRLNVPIKLIALFDRPQSEVPLYMNACDLLLITSDWEGSPNMVKEAMACNMPIVSTDVGDVREIITGTANCYICPQNPAVLAEQVIALLETGQRTDGRDQISPLSSDKIADRIISAYHELIRPRS